MTTTTGMPTTVIAMAPKSTALAYALLLLFGFLGVHRFYVGRGGLGQLILTCTGVGIIISGPWAFIDLFRLAGFVRQHNAKLGL